MTNIIIADSHPIVRIGLTLVLNSVSEFQLIDTAATTEALLTAIQKSEPNLVILEMDIPKINGIATIRKLKKRHPDVKAVIYSAQPESVYAMSCIKAGAFGYVPKTANVEEILAALTQIQQGKIYLSEAVSIKTKNDYTGKAEKPLFKKVSSREIEVLKLLASGKKNKEVAVGLNINEKTVSTYKSRLMKKLNVTNIVDLLQQAKALELY